MSGDDEVVADSLQNIIESTAKILQVKKGVIPSLPKQDQLMVVLCGEALTQMLLVENNGSNDYLIGLVKAFEDSFLTHKNLWIDVMVANQGKILEAFSGGMINE